jgi:hypothetical protein
MSNQDFDEQAQPDQQAEQVEQQQDPYTAAVERIQFGDSQEARDALISVTRGVVQHERNLAAIAEYEKEERQIIEEFEKAHPVISKDPLLSAAARQYIIDEQRAELARLGHSASDCAGASPDAVMQAHKTYRVAGDTRAKTNKQLLAEAVEQVESRFGIQARPTDIAAARSRAVVDRRAWQAALKEKPEPAQFWPARENEIADTSDSSEHVLTAISPEEDTLRALGVVQEAEAANAGRTATRDNAVRKMIADRKSRAGRNPKFFLKGE